MSGYTGFANLIRKRRKALNLRLHEVAKRADLSIPYVSELERAVKQPPQPGEALDRLAKALDIPREVLYEEAELSRRSVEVSLNGVGQTQRKLALMLARRIDEGLSDEEALDLIGRLSKMAEDSSEH